MNLLLVAFLPEKANEIVLKPIYRQGPESFWSAILHQCFIFFVFYYIFFLVGSDVTISRNETNVMFQFHAHQGGLDYRG